MIDLQTYIILSIVYLLTIHMAMVSTREFQFFLNIAMFALGGIIGAALDSYISGFVFAVVLNFMFWSKGSD